MGLRGVKMCPCLSHVAQSLLELRHTFRYPAKLAQRPAAGLLRKAEPLREAVPHGEIHCLCRGSFNLRYVAQQGVELSKNSQRPGDGMRVVMCMCARETFSDQT